MSNFRYCDNWVVMKLPEKGYKLLTGNSGGYLDGDSWRLNSGITSMVDDGDFWLVYGHSGSAYRCHKEAYTVRFNCLNVYNLLLEEGCEEMDEDTDWANVDWDT